MTVRIEIKGTEFGGTFKVLAGAKKKTGQTVI
jgi:hypothetical protein